MEFGTWARPYTVTKNNVRGITVAHQVSICMVTTMTLIAVAARATASFLLV